MNEYSSWNSLLFIIFILILIPCCNSAADTAQQDNSASGTNQYIQSDSGMAVWAYFPGKTIEAGDIAIFELKVKNNFQQYPRQLDYSLYTNYQWEVKFLDSNDDEVNRIDPPKSEITTVKVKVKTTGDTNPGEYPIQLWIGEIQYTIYITISKSHKNESGLLQLNVQNSERKGLDSVSIIVNSPGSIDPIRHVQTDEEGKVSIELSSGIYSLELYKPGYISKKVENIKIIDGTVTEIKRISLERLPNAVDISLASQSLESTLQHNPVYTFKLINAGLIDDTYKLSVNSLPKGWYPKFIDPEKPDLTFTEINLRAGNEKSINVEIIPSKDVKKDIYLFNLSAQSSFSSIYKGLILNVIGVYDMRVYSEKNLYDINKGDLIEIPLKVKNTGTAGALLNLHPIISVPEEWHVVSSPELVAGLDINEVTIFKIQIIPPVNIAPSEYSTQIKIVSDQVEKSDTFRINIHESSFVMYIGIVILVVILLGIYIYFKKNIRK
jgi:uncharacterized membrane protein